MQDAIDGTILKFLKANGPRLDFEIADALEIPRARIRSIVAALSSSGDVICCKTIQFKDGIEVEGISCRLAGYAPAAARGRKPGAPRKSEPDPNSES